MKILEETEQNYSRYNITVSLPVLNKLSLISSVVYWISKKSLQYCDLVQVVMNFWIVYSMKEISLN
jgi:hypothetical protein